MLLSGDDVGERLTGALLTLSFLYQVALHVRKGRTGKSARAELAGARAPSPWFAAGLVALSSVMLIAGLAASSSTSAVGGAACLTASLGYLAFITYGWQR